MVGKKQAQMKIQQMAFMIVALFFFFTLVGLFFLNVVFKDIDRTADSLAKGSALSSLQVIANMPELACGRGQDLCLDQDKVRVMAGSFADEYDVFWPVASVAVRTLESNASKEVRCPAANCNYYELFDSGQASKNEYATFISLCEQIREKNYVDERCKPAKLIVGVRDNG